MAGNFNATDGQELDDATDITKVERAIGTTSYDKSQTLVDIANNTFRELCRTLENEQTKLMELEERRKKLQEEMQRLKMEIEEEKQSYRLNLVDSVTDNLEALNACSSTGAALVEGMETETESVHDFIERQRAEIQRLNSETALLPPLAVLDEKNEKEHENEEQKESDMAFNSECMTDEATNNLNCPDECLE